MELLREGVPEVPAAPEEVPGSVPDKEMDDLYPGTGPIFDDEVEDDDYLEPYVGCR